MCNLFVIYFVCELLAHWLPTEGELVYGLPLILWSGQFLGWLWFQAGEPLTGTCLVGGNGSDCILLAKLKLEGEVEQSFVWHHWSWEVAISDILSLHFARGDANVNIQLQYSWGGSREDEGTVGLTIYMVWYIDGVPSLEVIYHVFLTWYISIKNIHFLGKCCNNLLQGYWAQDTCKSVSGCVRGYQVVGVHSRCKVVEEMVFLMSVLPFSHTA